MLGMPIWALYLLAGVALYGSGAASGWRVEAWHRDSVDEKRVAAADAARQKAEAKIAEVSADYEAERAKSHVEFRTITKDVDRVVTVYADRACLDDSGVQLANRALAGAADAGGPPRPVRKPDAPR